MSRGKSKLRKMIAFLVMASCFAIVGCNRDAEVDGFLSQWDSLTDEIARKINAGDIDGARSAFDAKKDDLRSKLASIRSAREGQISSDALKRFDESFAKNGMKMKAAFFNNWTKLGVDITNQGKLKALFNEYGKLFGTHLEIATARKPLV